MYKKYHIFGEKINIYNMITYLKRYPLSILVIAAILYLSFFKPPQTSLNEIKNLDKIVHICMYGGLTVILWSEHIRQHKKTSYNRGNYMPYYHERTHRNRSSHTDRDKRWRLAGFCSQHHRCNTGQHFQLLCITAIHMEKV